MSAGPFRKHTVTGNEAHESGVWAEFKAPWSLDCPKRLETLPDRPNNCCSIDMAYSMSFVVTVRVLHIQLLNILCVIQSRQVQVLIIWYKYIL